MKTKIALEDTDYRMIPDKIAVCVIIVALYALWHEKAWGNFLDLVDDYEGSIKIGIFAVGLVSGIRVFGKGFLWPSGVLLSTALALNPFLPLKLDRYNWVIIFFILGCGSVWAAIQIFRHSRMMVARLEIAKERARLVDEALADGRIDRAKHEAFAKAISEGRIDF